MGSFNLKIYAHQCVWGDFLSHFLTVSSSLLFSFFLSETLIIWISWTSPWILLHLLSYFSKFFSLLGKICSSFFQPFYFQSFNSLEFIFILWLFHFYGILFFLEGIITHLSDETNASFYLFVSFGVWFTSLCIVSLSHRLLFVSLVISVLVILDAFSMSQLIPFLLSLSTLSTCTSISFCLLLSVSPTTLRTSWGQKQCHMFFFMLPL